MLKLSKCNLGCVLGPQGNCCVPLWIFGEAFARRIQAIRPLELGDSVWARRCSLGAARGSARVLWEDTVDGQNAAPPKKPWETFFVGICRESSKARVS